MSDAASCIAKPLGDDEVRVFTIDTGDSATVRDAARRILSALAGIPLDEVEIVTTAKGKPLLRNDDTIHFSISHSRDAAMIAITRVAPVGVDIELKRAVPNAELILRRFFPHEDATAILADADRDVRFMEAWTRAEARVKARGATVWESAMQYPVTIARGLDAPDGFVASVAIAVASSAWTPSQHNISVADVVAL